jgi:hypothetical protein
MHRISEFLIGLLFGIGLLVSGMTDPGKVIGFLDLTGAWDPSLALVMGGPFWWACSRLVLRANAPPAFWERPCTCRTQVTLTAI